jgi:hypothetical protein
LYFAASTSLLALAVVSHIHCTNQAIRPGASTFLINNYGHLDRLLVRYIVALLEMYFTDTVQCLWIPTAHKGRPTVSTEWLLPGIAC